MILNSTVTSLLLPRLPLTFASQMSPSSLLSTSPCWFLCHLGEEIVIDALQKPPGLLVPCETVSPKRQTRVIQLLVNRSLEEDQNEMALNNQWINMNNVCKYVCIGFILEQFGFEEKYVAILIIIVCSCIITWKDCNMKGQKYHSGKIENRKERER